MSSETEIARVDDEISDRALDQLRESLPSIKVARYSEGRNRTK